MSNEEETNGASLLAALEIPSNARSSSSSSSSVSDCLKRFFSCKERPNKVVQSLLNNENSITPQAVRAAHEILMLQDYLLLNDTTSSSSWTVMTRVAATVWFVQLLLEYKGKESAAALPEEEANKMALLLLQNLCKTIKEVLRQVEKNDDDEDEEEMNLDVFHAPSIACFTVGALLKEVNPYVSSLPVLLLPLWKGICDVCSSFQTMPSEMAESTLNALVVYLQEGQAQTMTTVQQYCTNRQQVAPQQQAYQVKILSFLVARASVLLRVCTDSRRRTNDDNDDKSTSSKATSHAVTILLQLRGLTIATTAQLKRKYKALSKQDEAFLQAYQQLETKVELCLVNSWLLQQAAPSSPSSSKTPPTLERDELNKLLRLQLEVTSTTHGARELAVLSFHSGKAFILHHLLEQHVAQAAAARPETSLREQDVQSLLSICQELLFVMLPLCATAVDASALLSKCLNAMALTTVTCYVKGVPEHQCHLDRLLMKWLAPPTTEGQLHPLTRELLVSLVPLHTLLLCQAHAATSRSDSPRSVDLTNNVSIGDDGHACASAKPLLELLVKILMDPRTHTGHRRNAASVVIRLLNDAGGEGSSLATSTSTILQQVIAVELQQLIKQDVKVERRKRKKKPKSIDDTLSARPLGSFDVDDVRVVMQVLRCIFTVDLPFLDRDMACIARDLSAVDLTVKNQRYSVGNYSRNVLSLLLTLMSSVVDKAAAAEGQSVSDMFKTKTGVDMQCFASSLVQWLGQQQSRVANRTQGSLRKAHSVVILSCLHFICSSFGHVGMNDHDLRALVTLVKEYARVSCQALRSTPATLDRDEQRSATSIIFAITPLLAGIAKIIPTSCPADILKVSPFCFSYRILNILCSRRVCFCRQCIASTYKMLFETNAWPIVAQTVASLVRFASTIPSTHQGFLPECIPSEAQGLIQCRLQGLVFRDSDSHTVRS